MEGIVASPSSPASTAAAFLKYFLSLEHSCWTRVCSIHWTLIWIKHQKKKSNQGKTRCCQDPRNNLIFMHVIVRVVTVFQLSTSKSHWKPCLRPLPFRSKVHSQIMNLQGNICPRLQLLYGPTQYICPFFHSFRKHSVVLDVNILMNTVTLFPFSDVALLFSQLLIRHLLSGQKQQDCFLLICAHMKGKRTTIHRAKRVCETDAYTWQ